MLIGERIYLEAARADVAGVLRERGHEAATACAVSVMNSLIGSFVSPVEGASEGTVVLSWQDLAVFSGPRPSMSVLVYFRVMQSTLSQGATYSRKIELDVSAMFPENLAALEVMMA